MRVTASFPFSKCLLTYYLRSVTLLSLGCVQWSARLFELTPVFSQIFNLLDPVSLLHLSRASKALRGTLMGRSLTSLWQKSYAAEDLPPVPNDLNIPQFLSLVVDTKCDVSRLRHSALSVY